MKKLLILAVIGVTSISFLGAKSLGTVSSQVISAYNAVHVRNSVVNEGGTIRFNWSEPHVNATKLGCKLTAAHIDRHGNRFVVFTSYNPSGSKVIHNAKPVKYIIDFRCTYKQLGQKIDTKTVKVKFKLKPVRIDSSVESIKHTY